MLPSLKNEPKSHVLHKTTTGPVAQKPENEPKSHGAFTYEYPRPAVTVDAVILTTDAATIEVLLIKRGHPPFAGDHAVPGGFLEMDEQPVHGAGRELAEETGITGVELSPLFACGQVGRDPRSRNITMVFGALIAKDRVNPKGGDDAAEAGWFSLLHPPKMAFDHARLLKEILAHLRWQAMTALVGRHFLSPEFDSIALKTLHEKILAPDPVEETALIERGLRLGIIEQASTRSLWRFQPAPSDQPDYSSLVW